MRPHGTIIAICCALSLAACAGSGETGPSAAASSTVALGTDGPSAGSEIVIYRPAARRAGAVVTSGPEGDEYSGAVAVGRSGAVAREPRIRREPLYRVAEGGGRARAADRAAEVAQATAERLARSRTASTLRDFDLIETREDITLTEARNRRFREETALRRQGILDAQRRRATARLSRGPRLAPTLAERTDALQAELQARGRPSFSANRQRTRVTGGIPTFTGSLD